MNIGFIGAGNMGGALAKAVSRTENTVLLYDKDWEKAVDVAEAVGGCAVSQKELAESASFIFLGVKPNIITEVAKEISPILKSRTDYVLVTMAAGVSIGKLRESLGFDAPIIRIMPNTPVAYGEGMILYTVSEQVSFGMKNRFLDILSYAGRLDEISEKLIDAGSAISGCGPAFAYMFVEALADGGVACGLPREKAQLYAAQMLKGSASAVIESGMHPEQMKDAVCSPGGSTIEGVIALENGGFRGTVLDAVTAAYEKTLKLGK